MAGKINIDSERCKGCGLCLAVCPKQTISISAKSNRQGYFPAETDNCECTGCGVCALICPDAAIEVYRDEATPIVENVGPGNAGKPTVMQEKA
jgi:2-oxoglutarate ferredoxin oxidoreductase subunit delta